MFAASTVRLRCQAIIQEIRLTQIGGHGLDYVTLRPTLADDFPVKPCAGSHMLPCRPHGQHYGLSPDDALAGRMPDKRLFREKIEQARAKRPEINRNQVCGLC